MWGGNRWRARGDDGWRLIAPGVELRTLRSPGEDGAPIVAIRTTPNRIRIGGNANVPGGQLEADEWRRRAGAVAAVNGGYFDALGKSLGLRISNGKRLAPLHGKSWGVFYVRNGKAAIVPTTDFKMRRSIREAVQCGPRLVEDGRPLQLKKQWARRTALGVTRDGKVIVAVSDGDLSLPAWASLWASSSGLNCRDALNLDGGSSTQLSLQTSSRQLHLRSGRAVPDAVLIY